MKKQKINKSKIFTDPIIYTKNLLNGTMVVVDAKTTIRFLDKITLKVIKGFKTGIHHSWYKNAIVSFSNDGNYFATVSQEAKISILYDSNTKKTIAKVQRHQGSVSCVAIDSKGKYFFSCGEDGKTFVVDIKSAKLSFTLPTHIDAINDICFSANNQLVATASYDKQISIFNFAMMMPVARLKTNAAPVMKIHFLSENRLFSVDKSGSAIIWDLNTKRVIVRLDGIHDVVRAVTANSKFLFLGTELGYIMVYELENYAQLSRSFIKYNTPISSLEFDASSDDLIVGCENGALHLLYIYEGDKYLEELLENKEYDAMSEYVHTRPLLLYTKSYIVLSTIWEKTIQQARELLQNAQEDKAKQLLSNFSSPAKKTIIKKMFQEYAEFGKFVLDIKKGNSSLAYSLARKYPAYKESKFYMLMEDKWKKLFAKAQKMAQEGKRKEEIFELLSEYRGIPEKTRLIQEMVAKSEVFVRLKSAIVKKDFKVAFELIKVNPFLKEFEEYSKLLMYGDTLYITISKAIDTRDIHESIKSLRVLRDFPDYEVIAKKMIQDIESQGQFFKAVDDGDLNKAYTLLAKSELLENTQAGQKLIKQWQNDLALAEVYAINSDILAIDGVLGDYKNISSKQMSLARIYAWTYINQIEYAIVHNKEKNYIEKGFKNYILNFGIDDHIVSTFEIYKKKYAKTKLNLDALKKGTRAMWRPSMRVKNILK